VRAVIDTNVLISAHLWRGAPHALFARVRDGDVTLILSPALLAEFAQVIGRTKFQTILRRAGRPRTQILAELLQLAEMIDPPPLAAPVCRDADDDKLLALARAAKADIIISGDQDLLALGSFDNIRILNPAEALASLAPAPE
jgi:putative PIN family toxin of toxin-antitoxin system